MKEARIYSPNEGVKIPMPFVNKKTVREAQAKLTGEYLANPAIANMADIVPWVQYDRVSTSAGANTQTQYVFFQQPLGTNNKTKIDTNMEQVIRFLDPDWMDV